MKIKKQTLSIVIPVKNEEKIIQLCLDAVSWADEIIIIDNGSTDKSVEICKKYTNKIYSCPEIGFVPLLQNMGIEKASKDWVLIIDADIIVPKQAAEEIQERIQQKGFDCYYLPHKSVIMGKFMEAPFWTFSIMKLFRRGTAYFQGESAHQTMTFQGTVGFIQNPLLHYSHPTLEVQIKKANFYTTQDAKILFEKKTGGILKRKIKKLHPYHLVIQPILYFLYLFFYRKGYKDGVHGLIVDLNMGFYVFLEVVKLLEKKVYDAKERT